MKSSQRQTMKLQQKLSPQQILLMQLVQLPVTALEQRIKEEIEKNPVLEDSPTPAESTEPLPDSDLEEDDRDDLISMDTDDDDYSYRERLERDKNIDSAEAVLVSEASFFDVLLGQLELKDLNERQRAIAQEIVGSLDDAGYISRSTDLIANDLAFTQGLEVSPQEVLEVLAIVQQLDPPGIGARNLQECLSLQLHRAERQDDATRWATRVIDGCFDLFVNHNYNRVMEALQLDEQQLNAAIERIRRLNPKPGAGQSEGSHAHYIVPDFIVTRHDEDLQLMLNDSHLPQLQLNDYYQEMLQQLSALSQPTRGEKETVEFLRAKTDSANLLADTLRMRHVTMLKVMQAILRRQRRFFLTGNSADLNPLLQRDIAEDTGYDLSTISRVVNSKYVQTEFGTFLLKECFSHSIVNDEGEEVATETIRQLLRDTVEAEDKRNPLSDEALAKILNEKGYPVARRTVAKYRDMLGIPVCRLRRTLKAVTFLLMISLSMVASAQQPQKESYFDSLVNARIREGQAKSRVSPNAKGKTTGKTSVTHAGALEIHEAEPDPNVIDTALATGDELIDVMYNATLPPPSALWYGRNLSGSQVRLVNLSMDSLPDEISISLLKGTEKFCFPVKNIITSPYGWRWNRPHRGVDIRLKMGEPVRCAFNGVVRIARPMGAYGNLVVVRHYNGLETVYGHLSRINVKPMQVVAAGQTLGLGGSTGRSTGPHLHFEVRFQYEPFDPEWILDFSNYTLRTRRLYLDKTYFGIRKPRSGENLVYKADKSIIPEEQAKSKPKSDKPVYATLKKGEALEAFAKRNYTTVDKVKELNPDLKKPKSGTRLRVR
ncbi:MAG: RNA polymerase factor sigma-54 [Bacteroidales bacterium]|nr:RNA polymerase factor sigma-54 [Bacteroidales bacterium]